MASKKNEESLAGQGKSPFNVSALLELQRKNIEAMTEVQSLVLDAAQALARCHTEALSRTIGSNAEMVKEIWAQKSPEHRFAKCTDFADNAYRESVANCEEAARLLNRSGMEAAEIVNRCISSSLTEFKTALKPKGERSIRRKAA